MRTDREDTARQRLTVEQARDAVADSLILLAAEAKTQARVASTKTGRVDLTELHGLTRRLERAEEQLDIAMYDLHTARGGDG